MAQVNVQGKQSSLSVYTRTVNLILCKAVLRRNLWYCVFIESHLEFHHVVQEKVISVQATALTCVVTTLEDVLSGK